MCIFLNMYEQRTADVLWTHNKNYKDYTPLIIIKQSLFQLTFTCLYIYINISFIKIKFGPCFHFINILNSPPSKQSEKEKKQQKRLSSE